MRQRLAIVFGMILVLGCKPSPKNKVLGGTNVDAKSDSKAEVDSAETPAKPEIKLTADGRKIVRICVDEAETKPWSFQDGNDVKGIHADIARDALRAAGFEPQFKFLPWKRCIEHELKAGLSDTTLSAAWSEARENYLWYPADARELGPKCQSPSALICNGPVLLVPTDSPFKFTGDIAQIPQPVRVTFGYAQADDFRKLGMTVDDGPGDKFNVGKMVRDGNGSVLIWLLSMPFLEQDDRLKGKYRLVDGYKNLSDGFLPFSQRGVVTRDEAERIWTELKKLRADPSYQRSVFSRYTPTEAP